MLKVINGKLPAGFAGKVSLAIGVAPITSASDSRWEVTIQIYDKQGNAVKEISLTSVNFATMAEAVEFTAKNSAELTASLGLSTLNPVPIVES